MNRTKRSLSTETHGYTPETDYSRPLVQTSPDVTVVVAVSVSAALLCCIICICIMRCCRKAKSTENNTDNEHKQNTVTQSNSVTIEMDDHSSEDELSCEANIGFEGDQSTEDDMNSEYSIALQQYPSLEDDLNAQDNFNALYCIIIQYETGSEGDSDWEDVSSSDDDPSSEDESSSDDDPSSEDEDSEDSNDFSPSAPPMPDDPPSYQDLVHEDPPSYQDLFHEDPPSYQDLVHEDPPTYQESDEEEALNRNRAARDEETDSINLAISRSHVRALMRVETEIENLHSRGIQSNHVLEEEEVNILRGLKESLARINIKTS